MMGGVVQNRKGGFKTKRGFQNVRGVQKGGFKTKRRFQNTEGGLQNVRGVPKLWSRLQNEGHTPERMPHRTLLPMCDRVWVTKYELPRMHAANPSPQWHGAWARYVESQNGVSFAFLGLERDPL